VTSYKVHAEVWPGGCGLLDFPTDFNMDAVSFNSVEDAYRIAEVIVWKVTGEENPTIDMEWDEL